MSVCNRDCFNCPYPDCIKAVYPGWTPESVVYKKYGN